MLQVPNMLYFILLQLTFSEIVSDVPLDAGTLLVILLFAAFGGFIWYGSRSNPTDPSTLNATRATEGSAENASATAGRSSG